MYEGTDDASSQCWHPGLTADRAPPTTGRADLLDKNRGATADKHRNETRERTNERNKCVGFQHLPLSNIRGKKTVPLFVLAGVNMGANFYATP